ncbi:MAG TPA: hypothetical protein VKY92_14160, partial [Verrucomicrobiae bacterium]|nr:hypothetical protein [Verrucomicrobiae bacterium]
WNSMHRIAGTLKVQSKHRRLFSQLRGLDEITSIRQALRRPAWYLERLAAKVAQEWCPDGCKVLAGLNR